MAFALWQHGTGDGHDRCTLRTTAHGAELSGAAVLPALAAGATARYRLLVDGRWRVTEVDVHVRGGGGDARLRLLAPAPGRWERDGAPRPELDGCLDVALDFTPAGLTPLLRRVALAPGERADVDVVTLRLPGLAVTRERVGIEHDERDRWLHHVAGRTAALHVGPQGLVTEYEDAWTAVALG